MKDTRAVQLIAQDQREHIIDSGIVRAIRGQYVDVLLDGTKKLVRNVIVSKSIITLNTGWWVVIARVPRTNKWVALTALESISTGSTADTGDLTTPASVTATAKPYLIELSWSGSFRNVATYEVQHNASASETDATMLKVEGSNFFYWCAPNTTRYFRVRAVSSAYERSAWSSWVNATSTTGAAYMFLGVDAGATGPIWTAFNWTNVSGVAGSAMSHDHSTAAKGGQNLLSLVDLGFSAATELTISLGAVTRAQVYHRIDTQNNDPTDDLDTINGGADGKIMIIRPENDARTVVVKHNTGNIWLSGGADITLDDIGDALILFFNGAINKWVDIGWSQGAGGGAPVGAQYLVLALDGTLTDERQFVDGDGLTGTDAGAGSTYTLAVDATVVRTSGDQIIAGGKTFQNEVIMDAGAEITVEDAVEGASTEVLALSHLTTGDARSGFGLLQTFRLENDAGAEKDAAAINTRWTDATGGSEYAAMDFGVAKAGVVTTLFSIWSSIAGDFALASAQLDINGNGLILDSDGDTALLTPSDDQIDIKVANAVILRLVSTALKSQGSTFPDLGTTTLAEKLGNIYLGTAKDVYPIDDEAGLAERNNNWLSVDDHFGGAAFGGAWTWAGAPFATPGVANFAYNSLVFLAFDAGATPKGFLYRTDELTAAVTGIRVATQSFADGSYVGIRHDDGSDDNYVETAIRKTTGTATLELIVRYRTGGGGVTTTVKQTIYDYPMWMFVASQLWGTQWTNWGYSANYGINSPALNAYSSGASGLTWTPTRKGIIFYSSEASPQNWKGPYIDFYHSSG